jgi:aflatoxin B1 aldehyde reductase
VQIFEASFALLCTTVPSEGLFSDENTTNALYHQRYLSDSALNELDIIKPAADKHKPSVPVIAFRWLDHHSQLRCIEHGGDGGILLGVSNFAQLQGNLETVQIHK